MYNSKTTDEMLLSYTNIEIDSGLYVNSAFLKVFEDLKQELKFIKVEKNNHVPSLMYEYKISDTIPVNIYVNSKLGYLELVHFHDLNFKYDFRLMEVLNLANKNLRNSKVVFTDPNLNTVEIQCSYNGEFTVKDFVRLMQKYHDDVVNYYNIISFYMNELKLDQKKLKIKKEIKKIVSNKKAKFII
jgi:hypothetical protein